VLLPLGTLRATFLITAVSVPPQLVLLGGPELVVLGAQSRSPGWSVQVPVVEPSTWRFPSNSNWWVLVPVGGTADAKTSVGKISAAAIASGPKIAQRLRRRLPVDPKIRVAIT